MYRYDLVGYAYGDSIPLDLTWVGYTYAGDGKLHRTMGVNRSPKSISVLQSIQNGYLTLKFGPIHRYWTGF